MPCLAALAVCCPQSVVGSTDADFCKMMLESNGGDVGVRAQHRPRLRRRTPPAV